MKLCKNTLSYTLYKSPNLPKATTNQTIKPRSSNPNPRVFREAINQITHNPNQSSHWGIKVVRPKGLWFDLFIVFMPNRSVWLFANFSVWCEEEHRPGLWSLGRYIKPRGSLGRDIHSPAAGSIPLGQLCFVLLSDACFAYRLGSPYLLFKGIKTDLWAPAPKMRFRRVATRIFEMDDPRNREFVWKRLFGLTQTSRFWVREPRYEWGRFFFKKHPTRPVSPVSIRCFKKKGISSIFRKIKLFNKTNIGEGTKEIYHVGMRVVLPVQKW